MKTKSLCLLAFAWVPLLASCAEDGSVIDPLGFGIEEEVETRLTSARFNHPDVVAHRANYEIVIQDDDGWEIMLNLRKRRRIAYSTDSLFAYEGHLIYKLSHYLIIGSASAIYDPRIEGMAVVAKDSAWNRGMIAYTFRVQTNEDVGGYNMPTGTYHYQQYPHRMNAIKGRLIKGTIGELAVAQSSGLSETAPVPPLTPAEVDEIEAYIPRKHEGWERGSS